MNRRKKTGGLLIFIMVFFGHGAGRAGEVIPETQTEVVVREHPQTGQTYVSVTKVGTAPRKIFQREQKKFQRPDYRMLDPHVSPKSVGYDGPVSDRTKVYVLAGTLAAAGVTAYAVLPSAAAVGGAAAGGGFYAAAGAAVAAGTLSTHWVMARSNSPEDFKHTSLSREIKL